ncbi:uncharacterized protein LOC111101206 [Crassostrea virginica]
MSNPKVRVVLILVGFVFLKSNEKHQEALATRAASRVSDCPRNEIEWWKASKRLNCSDDAFSSVNRYHCLPADSLTTLLEFCYKRTRAQVVTGLCMVFIEKKNIVNHYNCVMFNEGCPNTRYYSNEMYKFPACFEIDPIQHCYKAEVSCQQFTRFQTDHGVLNTTLSLFNDTSNPSTTNTNVGTFYPLVIILPVLFLLGLIIAFVAWRMRRRMKMMKKHENVNWEFELGCLLQPLPSEQENLSIIDKENKIPQEIFYWKLKDRKTYVKSMKKGKISVYNGRGMVIGCARAGKSTLVKVIVIA